MDHENYEPRRRWRGLALPALVTVGSLALLSTVGYFVVTDRFGTGGDAPDGTIWTCAMDPSVMLDKPGLCPICNMDLTPLEIKPGPPQQMEMTQEAMALAEIQTTKVERRLVTKQVRMVGKIDYDESRLAYITARVPGRLDRLDVHHTGVRVRKGDPLIYLYSPELVVAQQELLQARRIAQQLGSDREDDRLGVTVAMAEEKLRLLGLLDSQIEEIKRRGKPSDHMTIHAPIGGVVIDKNANEGLYVQTGTRIYTIADLRHVWVYLDAYESDIPWLRYAQPIEFTTESYPGEIFQGRVAFIDPVLNETTRTVRVRVNVSNDDGRLKPGMFVRAKVRSRLAADGRVVDPVLSNKWICPVHPEIVKDKPNKCPLCAMDLTKAADLGFITDQGPAGAPLVIPASAPLLTGKRAIVYVKLPNKKEPTFEGREVMLGDRAGNDYIVRYGLAEGEEVVTHGNFKIDSSMQIQAKPSMMNPPNPAPRETSAAEVPMEFRVSLSPLYQSYLTVSEGLARDDRTLARHALGELLRAAKQIDPAPLDAEGRNAWRKHANRVVFAAYQTLDEHDRLRTRRHFSELSQAVDSLLEWYGHSLSQPVHRFHGPFAFRGRGVSAERGAIWLQGSKIARNPYLGVDALSCGEWQVQFDPQRPLEVPPTFRRQLNDLYAAYVQLQTVLADDDHAGAGPAAQRLLAQLGDLDARKLNGPAREAWQRHVATLRGALSSGTDPPSLEDARARFETVSITMLALVDQFGHVRPKPLYKVYCPMAFENRGAAWLQADRQVENPYFGASMLRCGSVKRTYQAVTSRPRVPAAEVPR